MFWLPKGERRSTPFQEWLSRFMVRIAAGGAFWVLMDPKLNLTANGMDFVMNSGAFSNDLKGAVISAILIGGFTSVREFWLGASKGGQEQAQAVARMAEAAPSVAAAVVANAAVASPLKTDDVKIETENATVIEKEKDK